MIFSRLGNIELEKRTSVSVGSSDFITLNRLKTFFHSSSVSDVLMMKIYLNLPTLISFANGNSIEYLYNAAGIKIEKKVHDTQNNTIKQVEYIDGFQYAGGVLQFFPTAEGYVAATPGGIGPGGYTYIFNYVYNYTDHLGNIRLSYTKDPVSGDLEIMEENHYYPFGLKHAVYADPKQMYLLDEEEENLARPAFVYETEYQYKYNGKEWQDELGLNMYDMDMRQYDPAIARWVVLDPVTHHPMSPYNAFDNNPVFWADPSGASVVTYTGEAAQEFIRREKKRLDDQIAQNAQKYGPPKDNWWRRTTKSIGCFFGINCGSNTPEPTQRLVMQKGDIEVIGIQEDHEILTIEGGEPIGGHVFSGLETVIEGATDYVVGQAFDYFGWNKEYQDEATMALSVVTSKGKPNKVSSKLGSSWEYGAFKTEAKWTRQFSKRGWTAEQVTEAVTKGKSFEAVNMVNKANGATRYVYPTTGQSVVIDNVTKELLHVGGPGFKY